MTSGRTDGAGHGTGAGYDGRTDTLGRDTAPSDETGAKVTWRRIRGRTGSGHHLAGDQCRGSDRKDPFVAVSVDHGGN